MIFMGSYKGGRGSSTDDSTDDQPEHDPDQSDLDRFDEPKDDTSESDDGSGTPVTAIPGSSVSGGGGGSVSVVGEPSEDEPETDDGEEPDDTQVEEPDDDEQQPEDEHESEEEDEDEDDDEDETVTVTITVDPFSAMSWGIQPVLKRVKENYGDQVEIKFRVAPVRTFDDSAAMREQWEASTTLHDMPVDLSFWDDPPGSTELVNRALIAAMRQGAVKQYLRALWIQSIADGQNLSNEVALDSLASRIGLDVTKFQEDIQKVDLNTGTEPDELPITEVPIKGYTQKWTGNVQYVDFKQQFIFEDLNEGRPQDPDAFVDEHGPVATAEVMEVYQWDRDEAMEELSQIDRIYKLEIGEGTFWIAE